MEIWGPRPTTAASEWETVATGRGFNFQIQQRHNGRWHVRRRRTDGDAYKGAITYKGDFGLRDSAVKDARERAEKWAGGKVLFS